MLDEGENHLVADDQTFTTELNMSEIEKDSPESLKSKLWDKGRTIQVAARPRQKIENREIKKAKYKSFRRQNDAVEAGESQGAA